MAVRFTGRDMISLALEIEKNGAAFYEACLNRNPDDQAARVFRFMLGEERRHIDEFRQLESLASDVEDADWAMSEEEEKYLIALAASNIFTAEGAGDEIAEIAESPVEVLELALQFEKDSVLFYSAFHQFVTDAAKPLVAEIIRQEKNHIARLSELRGFLNS